MKEGITESSDYYCCPPCTFLLHYNYLTVKLLVTFHIKTTFELYIPVILT